MISKNLRMQIYRCKISSMPNVQTKIENSVKHILNSASS